MTSFKLKNKYLVGLGSWLNELQLEGRESRERTRFVNQLIERMTENEKFRTSMLDKYVNKDKDGEKKKKLNEQKIEVWDIPEEKIALYGKEYTEFMDEEYVMDILDGNKQKIKIVKEIVLNTDYKFGPKDGDKDEEKIAKVRQAADYEIWCQSFEAVDFKE